MAKITWNGNPRLLNHNGARKGNMYTFQKGIPLEVEDKDDIAHFMTSAFDIELSKQEAAYFILMKDEYGNLQPLNDGDIASMASTTVKYLKKIIDSADLPDEPEEKPPETQAEYVDAVEDSLAQAKKKNTKSKKSKGGS